MVEITNETGGANIERKIFFKRDNHEYQQISVTAYCEGAVTPDETKQITEIVERAGKEIKKIVEEW